MKAEMPVMLADGINVPFVLMFGIGILVPLLLFQVGVEGFVLARVWRMRFSELKRFVFRANVASLIAGIPTKILNATFYGLVLPWDNLAVFFRRYPWAVAVGTLLYFGVTVIVEAWRAYAWNTEERLDLTGRSIWKGMLLANLATYVVLAPAHYFLTRPITDVRNFTEGAAWSNDPTVKILMFEPESLWLKVCNADGTATENLVPEAADDYLVSADLRILLCRGTNGTVRLVRRDVRQTNSVPGVNGGLLGTWTAFSPGGERVASVVGSQLAVFDAGTERISWIRLPQDLTNASIAWTTNRNVLRLADTKGRKWVGELSEVPNTVSSNSTTMKLTQSEQSSELLECFVPPRKSTEDECGNLTAMAFRGLSSMLRIYETGKPREPLLSLSVNPGVMHITSAQIESVQFLEECHECVFQANDAVYLLDISGRRAGRISAGNRPQPMTKRFVRKLGFDG